MTCRSTCILINTVFLTIFYNFLILEGSELDALNKADASDTTLTAWFKLNQTDSSAHAHLYHNIPNFYTFTNIVIAKSELIINPELAKSILLMAGENIECLRVIAEKRKHACEVLETFNYLQEKGYGEYREERSARGPSKKVFKKKRLDILNPDEKLVMGLEVLDKEVDKYVKQYEAVPKGILNNSTF